MNLPESPRIADGSPCLPACLHGHTHEAPCEKATLRDRIGAAIDRLRDNGAVYALDDHERDAITSAVLDILANPAP